MQPGEFKSTSELLKMIPEIVELSTFKKETFNKDFVVALNGLNVNLAYVKTAQASR